MKRFFSVILIIGCISLVGLYAGGKGEEKTSKPGGPTTVIYYLWDDPSLKPVVDGFNAAQKEVIVDARYIPSPDYETKITTLLTAHAEMDAYMQKRQSDMFAHFDNGFIEPLDAYLKQPGVDTRAVDAYRDAVTIEGKVVAVPWRGAAYYTFYNKKLFEKAGISTPDVYVKEGTWTWDKFAEVSRKVSSGDGTVYGATVYIWGSNHLFMQSQNMKPIIDSKGNIDYDDSVHRFFKMRKELEEAKAMWPLIDMKVTKSHYSKQFYDGKAAMLLIGEWFPGFMLSGRDQNLLKGFTWNDWGITRLPCDSKPYITQGNPTFNHVTSYAKQKEAAFRFIGWMGGPEGAKIAAKAGVLPATITPEVKEILANAIPDPQSLEYFTESKKAYPMLMTKYGSRIEVLVNNLLEEYLLGKISDKDFDARFRAGLKEIIQTTN
ncbi:MAG: extracellular solute-binding protein [Spirochaetales bacterium]|nr:extracellular solute-binding protein [Spirochaetales bacterium]